MPALTAADTIRILVATDSHVGFGERDPIRGDDSWKSFHEVMCLAREQDVDMVLLAGDLFHDNQPSRKSMYQVMRSLRMNCYGEKPCELEMLSDATENFQGAFNHVNYEDPDINVAIPVFSIHGNHDDPTGEGHLAALDLLQISGLVNYYGRTPESDNIVIKPVLLQKGHTKLALYGMSNVRDERLFRTFRDGKVKFYQPNTQKKDWFNLMSVHQNHHAYTDTGYLPENFLPEFLDLVVWGHEHECLIDPRYNPETSFHVMQPGSSVATSLVPGEAVPKHVAVLSITGRDFKVETIRLRSVRPFVMKEIVLADENGMKELSKKESNRTAITTHLMSIVNELIEQAKSEWLEIQAEDEQDEELEVPLPLIRLRVEYTAPEGGKFDCENPQRFSNRFVGKVANVNDVVQFHRRKAGAAKKSKGGTELPEEAILAALSIDNVKVEKLVREFLTAQSLTILPQNSFGDAVSQFVDKDDKHAMEMFVNESLANQIKHLLDADADEDEIQNAMDQHKSKLEELFAAGLLKTARKAKLKPKPLNWDTDLDGEWGDQPGALLHSEHEASDNDGAAPGRSKAAPRGRGGKKAATTRKPAAAPKKAPAAKGGRGKKKVVEEESEEDDDDDVIMVDSHDDEEEEVVAEDDEEEETLFVKPVPVAKKPIAPKAAPAKKPTAAAATKRAPARAAATPASRQSKLNFSQTGAGTRPSQANGKRGQTQELSDDEISDDDDAFEPAPLSQFGGRSRRGR
ncbi:MAG: meiotic recombination [Candelina submexicana]|nr:MAG: meiotic recombination [Candelina submexicana]